MGVAAALVLNVLTVIVAGVAFLGPFWMSLEVLTGDRSGYGLFYEWVQFGGDFDLDAVTSLVQAAAFSDDKLILLVQVCAGVALAFALLNIFITCCGSIRAARITSLFVALTSATTWIVWLFTDAVKNLRETSCNGVLCESTPISITLLGGAVLTFLWVGYFAAVLTTVLALISVCCSNSNKDD